MAQANKDIAPSCSKDWTDLDIYLKHNTGKMYNLYVNYKHNSFSLYVKPNSLFYLKMRCHVLMRTTIKVGYCQEWLSEMPLLYWYIVVCQCC